MPARFGRAPFNVSGEDWRIITAMRANALIVGPEPLSSEFVEALLPALRAPVAKWTNSCPEPADPCGTLLLQDPHQLDLADQQRLDEWLSRGHQTQVVTVVPASLFPLVEQGRFLVSLYYRLNVVHLAFEPPGG